MKDGDDQGSPTAHRRPDGLIEVRQFNAAQGWHSGYLTPERARALAADLVRLSHQAEVGGR